MHHSKATVCAATLVVLFACGVRDAAADMIAITASISDRGADAFPWDGIMASVFGNPSVVQITTPTIVTLVGTEERTAVEFSLGAIPAGSTIDAVTLQLSPVGMGVNIGLVAGASSEIHGYAGDGAIQVADLNDSLLVGSLAGPVANGTVLVVLSTSWLQSLVDSSAPFGGLMFKGVPGAVAVTYNFDSAFGGVPVAERPTLNVEYHGGAVVPEPSTVVLLTTGLALAARRRGRRLPSKAQTAVSLNTCVRLVDARRSCPRVRRCPRMAGGVSGSSDARPGDGDAAPRRRQSVQARRDHSH